MKKSDIENILDSLKISLPLEECINCECYQGFLVQLHIDFPEYEDEIMQLIVDDTKLHKCLGCNPCPPANIFVDYLTKKE